MGKEHFISLITKKLNSELSVAELSELNNWLSDSSNNATVLSDFKDVWGNVSSYKSATTFDADAAFESFVKKYNIEIVNSPLEVEINGFSSFIRLAFATAIICALIYGGIHMVSNQGVTFDNTTYANKEYNLDAFSTTSLAPNSTMKYNKESATISKMEGQAFFDIGEKGNSINLNFDEVQANAKGALA